MTRPRIVALIPAHNEERRIGPTLQGLRAQTWPVDRVVAVADNCTDRTVEVARIHGADVLVTQHNKAKKAGALNQAFAVELPPLHDDDFVLVLDADTVFSPTFVGIARRVLLSTSDVGAVGGVFYGEPGAGLVGQLQRNEYYRYAREIDRRNHKASVLTGTGTLLRVSAARQIIAARQSGLLPDGGGGVYQESALTEDNELTLALRTLGWRCVSPRGCRVTTEVMPTWRDLWRQRKRWQRGALDNLRTYGVSRVTAPYVAKQTMMYFGIFATLLLLAVTVVATAINGLHLNPFWLGIGGIFLVERVVTVRKVGLRGVLLAVPIVFEMWYDMFQQAVYLRCLADIMLGKKQTWYHVRTG